MSRLIEMVDSLIDQTDASPMTLEYVRSHLRSLGRDEDELVQGWIYAAAQFFEAQTGRQIMTATRELWLDAFPGVLGYVGRPSALRIELPRPPLQRVVSVTYVAADGTVTPVTDGASPETPLYQVKAPAGIYARRGWVEPLYGQIWPIARCERGSVRIQYVAGYGDRPEDVPELVAGILCYVIGQFDQFRMPVVESTGRMEALPIGLQMLMDEFKYSALPSGEPRASHYGHAWHHGLGPYW